MIEDQRGCLCRVTHAAVDKLRAAARGAGSKVARFEQQRREPARRSVQRDPDAGCAAADDDEIPRFAPLLDALKHRGAVHSTTLRDAARTRRLARGLPVLRAVERFVPSSPQLRGSRSRHAPRCARPAIVWQGCACLSKADGQSREIGGAERGVSMVAGRTSARRAVGLELHQRRRQAPPRRATHGFAGVGMQASSRSRPGRRCLRRGAGEVRGGGVSVSRARRRGVASQCGAEPRKPGR